MVDAFDPSAEDAGTVPGVGNTYENPANNAMLEYRRVLGGRTISTTRFGFNSYSRDILPENYGTDAGGLWGVDWLEVRERDYAYPAMSIAGYSKVGDTGTLPIQRKSSTYQLVQGVTMDRGQHLWQFGGEVRHQRLDGNLGILARGSLSFSGLLSGAGMSDLLLGYPSFTLQSKSDNTLRLRTTSFSAYAQDGWRLGPDVTVNLGLRYEYYAPATDPTNHMSAFDPDTGTVVPVGANGMSNSGIASDVNNIAPRVGIAWQVRPGLVVRGGYGLYYDSGLFKVNSAMYFNPPQFTMRAYFPTQYSWLTLGNLFPTNGGFAPPPSISTLDPDLVTSSMQHWNASVQRDLGPAGALVVGYAGSKGASLVRSRDLNQPRPGPVIARWTWRSPAASH
jgi:outer membrane receptor protein involved in Fe transport